MMFRILLRQIPSTSNAKNKICSHSFALLCVFNPANELSAVKRSVVKLYYPFVLRLGKCGAFTVSPKINVGSSMS